MFQFRPQIRVQPVHQCLLTHPLLQVTKRPQINRLKSAQTEPHDHFHLIRQVHSHQLNRQSVIIIIIIHIIQFQLLVQKHHRWRYIRLIQICRIIMDMQTMVWEYRLVPILVAINIQTILVHIHRGHNTHHKLVHFHIKQHRIKPIRHRQLHQHQAKLKLE